jgi:thioredoxin-like negative regulator of GroEL
VKSARRLWLVPLVAALAGLAAWYSAQRRASTAVPAVDLSNGRPKLLEFGMGICEQCQRLKPVMEQAARELGGRVEVHTLDVRQEAVERLSERFKVVAIPLVVLADGAGRELWRHEGFIDYPALSSAVASRLVPPAGSANGR